MAHNKIVLVTIHQPTSKLFQMFSKALLLDKGGRSSSTARRRRCWNTSPRRSTSSISAPSSAAARPAAPRGPEFIFDVLETPLRDSERRHHLRGKLAGPARAGAPFLARLLARQIRVLPPAPGHEAGEPAQDAPTARRWPAVCHAAAGPRSPSAGATSGRNSARSGERAFLSQAAQPASTSSLTLRASRRRSPRSSAGRCTTPRPRRIRFRQRLPHPDLHLHRAARGDVPRAHEQRGRHHPRPRDPASRAQSRRAAAVLHRGEVRHAGALLRRCSARSSCWSAT